MIVTEITPIADADLPVDAFKQHLKLGTGFSDDSIQDPVLMGFLRAAIVSIEGRIGRIILKREFEIELGPTRRTNSIKLPISPIKSIVSVAIENQNQILEYLDKTLFYIDKNESKGAFLGPFPSIPQGSQLVSHVSAGIADDWDSMPSDLAQAIFLLATHYYEHRQSTTLGSGCTPFGVISLIERYKVARLSLGGRT